MKGPSAAELLAAAWQRLLLPASIAGAAIGVGALGLFALGGSTHPEAGRFGMLNAVAGIAGAFSMVALQSAFGSRLLSMLHWDRLLGRWVELALFGWALGFVVSSGAAMALAAAGALNLASVTCTAAGLAIVGAPTITRAVRHIIAEQVDTWRDFDGRALPALALAAAAIAVALLWSWPLLVQTVLPNTDWDSALYHLPLASRYLAGELWNTDPVFSAYSFPGAVSLMYAAFLSLGLETAIIPFNFAALLMTLVATVSLATRIGGARIGTWAGVILATTQILWQLGVDPRIDIFVCLLVLLSMYAFSLWMIGGRRHEALYLVALMLSGALGCKYSALLYSAGIGGAALAALIWQSRRDAPGRRALQIATLALLFAIPHGSWYAANWWIHGDPVFAMLRGDYALGADGQPRYLAEALREPLSRVHTDPELQPLYAKMSSVANQTAQASLFDLPDLLLRPGRYSPKPNHSASPLLLAFLVLPALLLAKRRSGATEGSEPSRHLMHDPERRRLLWIYCAWGIGFYCVVATQIPILRYQLPIFPLLAIGAACVLGWLPNAGQLLFAGLALVLLASNGYAERHKFARLDAPAYFSGNLSRLEWLSRVGYNGEPSMPLLIDFVEQSIASGDMQPDDLVLMIGEGKGYLLGCRYLPDSSWSFQRWLGELLNAEFDHARLRERLRAQGVTHILYNRGYYDWVLSNTETPRDRLALGVSHLRRFLREHGTEIYHTQFMRLVRVRD